MVLCKTDPYSDVELALVDEQGLLDVLLNDERIVAYLNCVVIAFFLSWADLELFGVTFLLDLFWIVFFFVYLVHFGGFFLL